MTTADTRTARVSAGRLAPVIVVDARRRSVDAAARLHQPGHGRLSLPAPPRSTEAAALTEITSALMRALCADATTGRNAATAHRRCVARMRAMLIRDVIVSDAQRLGLTNARLLAQTCLSVGARLWLLDTQPGNDPSAEAQLSATDGHSSQPGAGAAATNPSPDWVDGRPAKRKKVNRPGEEGPHMTHDNVAGAYADPDDRWHDTEFADYWAAHTGSDAPTRAADPATATDAEHGIEPAQLPDTDMFAFLGACKELLPAEEDTWVRQRFHRELTASEAWLARRAGRSRAPSGADGSLPADEVTAFLLTRYEQTGSMVGLTVSAHAATLALARAGWTLSIDTEQLTCVAHRHPTAAQRTRRYGSGSSAGPPRTAPPASPPTPQGSPPNRSEVCA